MLSKRKKIDLHPAQTDELKTTRLYTSVFMTKVYRKKLNLQA